MVIAEEPEPGTAVSSEIKSIWRQTPKGEFATTLLDDEQVAQIIKDNPQKHKEAGFDWGYPSRFATIFDLAKEFGFVFQQTHLVSNLTLVENVAVAGYLNKATMTPRSLLDMVKYSLTEATND